MNAANTVATAAPSGAEAWIPLIAFGTKAILLLLALLSILSFAIMIDRRRAFRLAHRAGELARFKARLSGNPADTPAAPNHPSANSILFITAEVLRTSPPSPEVIAYALKSRLADERLALSRGLSVLATLGSNAPFIGLFGTVLGIIQSFATLSNGTGDMTAVIARLAEALITTAVGLFVAIPAVVAYNGFSQRLRTIFTEAESLRDAYLAERIYSSPTYTTPSKPAVASPEKRS